ncbi:MAG: hypothetical protein EPO22_01645 [Dehalococcoidia bacterium]|nr:MAG: hypothetical protein EPO22_01645 [Dehalococcoidia bacterium]
MAGWAREQVAVMAFPELGSAFARHVRRLREDRASIGLEMGVMLVVPLVVVATIGASLMRAGQVASRDVQSSVLEALKDVGSGIQANGPVIARTDGARVTHLLVDVTITPGGPPDLLNRGAGIDGTTASYIDSEIVERDVPYTVRWISGNGDAWLDGGEVAEIDIDLGGIATRDRFTVELRPPRGAHVSLHVEVPVGRPRPRVLRLG